jgi:hypothetical protein
VNDEKEPQAESARAASATSPSEPRPDVEIEASASAGEVRAFERPRIELSVKGGADARQDDSGQRENLPRRLEPGRMYRDVRVYRRLAGRLLISEQDG